MYYGLILGLYKHNKLTEVTILIKTIKKTKKKHHKEKKKYYGKNKKDKACILT